MKSHLIGPRADPLALGGVALLLAVLALPLGRSAIHPASVLALDYAFTFPHFLATYALFYSSTQHRARYRTAGIWIPTAFAAVLLGAVAWGREESFIILAQLSLFLLHWHYLKQAYGAALWLGYRPSAAEAPRWKKDLLLLFCLISGAAGFFGVQAPEISRKVFGVVVPGLAFPAWGATSFVILARVLFAGFLCLVVLDCIRGAKARFSWQVVLPAAALFTWFEPTFAASPAHLILPVFHGLQYLPFPARVYLNRPTLRAVDVRDRELRLLLAWGGLGLAGAVLFLWIPRWLAPQLAAAVLLFLNAHHYVIDGAIWKLGDPRVREALQR